MKRLLVVASCCLLASCSHDTDGALRVTVTLDAKLEADCFEVDLKQGGNTLAHTSVRRDAARSTYTLGVKQADLPSTITVEASAYLGDCEQPDTRKLGGRSAPVDKVFPRSGVENVELRVNLPDATLDGDQDGFVDGTKGGADCNDHDRTVHPGAPQLCERPDDTNCDGLVGCDDPACATDSSCQDRATALAFAPATLPPTMVGGCSASTVKVIGATGADTTVSRDTAVSFDVGATGLTVHSSAKCGPSDEVTSLTIPYRQGSAALWVKGAVAGDFPLVARATGLSDGTLLTHLSPKPVNSLTFSSAAQTIDAGACSDPLTVQVLDASGAPTSVSVDTALGLSGNPAQRLSFYAVSDANCRNALAAPASVTLAAGQGSVSFRAKATMAALPSTTYQLSATDSASHAATQPLTVRPGVGTSVVFVSPQPSVQVGACSGTVTLQLRDGSGNRTTVTGSTPISIALDTSAAPSGGALSYYTAAGCAPASALGATPATLGSGASEVVVYVKASAVGIFTMRALALGQSATQDAVVGAGPPVKVVITAGANLSVRAGDCSAQVTVQAQDGAGFPSGPAANAPLTLNAPSDFKFFSDASCNPAAEVVRAEGVVIPAGVSSASFYFSATRAGTVTLAVTGLGSDSKPETITAAAPARLTWASPTPTSATAGGCSAAFTLQVEDQYGNPTSYGGAQTVGLSSTPGGLSFSTASNCSGAGSTVPLTAGASTATIFVTGTAVQPSGYTIGATVGAVTAASSPALAVTAAAADRLVFRAAPPATSPAGACVRLDIDRRDAFGNAVPVTANTTVTLVASGPAPSVPDFFTSSASCGSGSAATTTTSMTGGSSTTPVWIRGRSIGTASFSASMLPLLLATGAMTVTPGPQHHLVLTLAPQPLKAWDCTATAQVSRQDQFNNPATDATALDVTLTSAGAGASPAGFYTATNCTSTKTSPLSAQIAAGQSAIAFGFNDTLKETVTINAAAAGVAAASTTVSVIANTATQVVFVNGVGTATAGVCTSTLTLEARDTWGNPSNPVAALPVGLSSNAAVALAFYPGTGCGVASQASVSIPSTGNPRADFSFKATRAPESISLTATPTGTIPPVSQGWATVAGAPTKLAWKTAPPATLVRYACGAGATVQVQDSSGNPSGLPSGKTFNLNSSATGAGLFFYADASGCSSPLAAAQLAPAAGATEFSFAPLGLGSGSTNVTVSDSASALTATPVATLNVSGAQGTLITSPAGPLSIEAADCVAVTVTRSSAHGATTLNLSLSATGTLSLHSDSACTSAAITTAGILEGQSAVTVYLRGRSGDGVATVNFTAADAAGFFATTPALVVTPLPLVRRGNCDLGATASSSVCTVAIPAGDISRSFLVFQATVAGTDAEDSTLTCGLSSSSGIARVGCLRLGPGVNPVVVPYQVVSFGAASGVSVQHLFGGQSAGDANPVNRALPTPVAAANTFLLFSHASRGTSVGVRDFATARLRGTGSTVDTLVIQTSPNDWPGALGFGWDANVVTMPGTVVDRGNPTTVTGLLYDTGTTLTTRTANRVLPLFTTRVVQQSWPETFDICKQRWRAGAPANNQLTFTRGAVGSPSPACSDANANVAEFAWERIELPSTAQVWTYTKSLTAKSNLSANVTLNPAVTMHRTVVLMPGQGPSGQSSGETEETSSSLGFATASLDLVASNQLAVTRGDASTSSNSVFTVFVVQFSP